MKKTDKMLYKGVKKNNKKRIEEALLQGANVYAKNKKGVSSLGLAIDMKNWELVELLHKFSTSNSCDNNYFNSGTDNNNENIDLSEYRAIDDDDWNDDDDDWDDLDDWDDPDESNEPDNLKEDDLTQVFHPKFSINTENLAINFITVYKKA